MTPAILKSALFLIYTKFIQIKKRAVSWQKAVELRVLDVSIAKRNCCQIYKIALRQSVKPAPNSRKNLGTQGKYWNREVK